MNAICLDAPNAGCGINVASILVFDEEVDSCNLLRRVLEREGHHVTTCANSDEAFRLISSNPPDLVVAHIRSGKRETLEMASRIKRIDSRLTVMTISDYFSEAVEPAVGDAFLIKPVEIHAIETKVRELLASRRGAADSSVREKTQKL
jgi:DNA-binding NtrC family response regulator